MNTKKKTNQKKKVGKNSSLIIILLLLLLGIIVGGGYYSYHELFKTKSSAVTIVSQIDDYSYYLNSNTTRLYRKYYKLLEEELKDSKVDEKNYVTLLSQLFTIDFYTLSNKLTNKDIGGIKFVASNLKEKFQEEASSTIYKYVNNNNNQKRTQQLPEVKQATVTKIENTDYEEKEWKDSSGYIVDVQLEYVEDLGYPKEVKLTFIHEENKLVLVEITDKK